MKEQRSHEEVEAGLVRLPTQLSAHVELNGVDNGTQSGQDKCSETMLKIVSGEIKAIPAPNPSDMFGPQRN
ncbi:MAG: hypothetical protein V1928_00745 [Parcubacteria group bacterium]